MMGAVNGMRLLFECTYVFEHPEVNSGIQRVVRNMIAQLDKATEVECLPVMMQGGHLYQVNSLAPLKMKANSRAAWIVHLEHWRNRYWWWHSRVERLRPFSNSRNARRLLFWPCKALSLGIALPLRGLQWLNRHQPPAPQRAVALEHRAGDQLVLLDSSWHADFFPLAERLKQDGVGIISVVYDLIPLTHPQFCDDGLVKVFDRWFDWISRTADGFLAISQTISYEVQEEVERRLGEEASRRWHGHFHLGSELDLADERSKLDDRLQQLFKDPAAVYLAVSTIEPRKNHRYLLDTFEILWQQGSSARLCIIGKVGWKCEALISRIKKHPELGKRLFMFNGLNDRSLEYAYRNARALVFPSYVEGFGLPLVEAMQRGLPVMASDIPVFREVGNDFIAYFDLNDPASLTTLVTQFEDTGIFPAARPVSDWRWIDWHEASQQLIQGVLKGLHSQAHGSPQCA